MAEGSDGTPVIHKVWTFVIRGGDEFSLTMPRTPRLDHSGEGQTMWKMVGTARIAESVKQLLEETGATVELHTEGQNAEQEALRKQRLGLD
tara:strand:- start:401 stop:673 length:273 start_codon:yes stop_codon:yes gene_type:complete